MRWLKVCLGSVATGLLAILLSLTLLFLWLYIYSRYVLRIRPDEAIGWDPVSAFGRYWHLGVIGIPILIFGLGCTVGFWFFNRRLRG